MPTSSSSSQRRLLLLPHASELYLSTPASSSSPHRQASPSHMAASSSFPTPTKLLLAHTDALPPQRRQTSTVASTQLQAAADARRLSLLKVMLLPCSGATVQAAGVGKEELVCGGKTDDEQRATTCDFEEMEWHRMKQFVSLVVCSDSVVN